MALCELTTGFELDCKTGIGGVKKIYLTDWNNLNGTGDVTFNADEVVTALTTTGEDLYAYDLPPQTASFEETITANNDNGTVFYTQTLNIMLHKLSSDKRLELQNAGMMRLAVFVLDAMDNWLFFGLERSANITTSTGATGAKLGDMNGYTISIVAESNKRAYFCEGDPANL
jgi:hypothetical protein